MTDELVKQLREVASEKQSEAWGRVDGGQDYLIGAMLAEECADRIEAQAAEIERLRDALAKAGRDLNMARYGQPDFAWSIHKQAMTDIQAKLENLIGGAETVLEAWDHHMRDVVVSASLNDAIEELRADVAELKGAKP